LQYTNIRELLGHQLQKLSRKGLTNEATPGNIENSEE
jgi:hypothetical protein